MVAIPIRIVTGLADTDEVGRAVDVLPIRYVPGSVAVDETGRPVDALVVQESNALDAIPVRVLDALTDWAITGDPIAVYPAIMAGNVPVDPEAPNTEIPNGLLGIGDNAQLLGGDGAALTGA